MKTSDLIGQELDEWVARAEGLLIRERGDCKSVWRDHGDSHPTFIGYLGGEHVPQYAPSTDPSMVGEIMDRCRIGVDRPCNGQRQVLWRALGDMPTKVHKRHNNVISAYGKTLMVAVMRVRVMQVYGKTVPDKSTGDSA